jgi:hypothetical protein
VDFDAEHRPLVGLVQIPSRDGGWRLTRSRQADDVNAEMREAVDQYGYSFFRIGLSLSYIPKS